MEQLEASKGLRLLCCAVVRALPAKALPDVLESLSEIARFYCFSMRAGQKGGLAEQTTEEISGSRRRLCKL